MFIDTGMFCYGKTLAQLLALVTFRPTTRCSSENQLHNRLRIHCSLSLAFYGGRETGMRSI